jgi:PhoH-like ATPase
MTEYGYKELQLTDEQLAEFYSNQTKFIENLYENEYLILKDASGAEIENYIFQRGFLKKINYSYIENKYCGIIKPRNLYQKLAIHMLQDTESHVKIIRGVYGSGKDLLMFNEALAQLEHGNYQKIIYVRPNVTVANVPDIGFLKGDLEEKLGWTLGPLIDKIGGEEAFKLLIKDIGNAVPAQYYLIKSDGNVIKGTYIVKDGKVISIK